MLRSLVIGATVLALGGLAGLGLAQRSRFAPPEMSPPRERAPQAMLQEVQYRVREGNWGQAKAILEGLRKSYPDFEPSTIALLQAAAVREAPNEQHLDAARAALAAGLLADASRELKAVSSDTAQGRVRDALDKDLHGALEGIKGRLRALTASKDLRALDYTGQCKDALEASGDTEFAQLQDELKSLAASVR
jgi:uncharacterized protein (DUF2236 family)